MVQFSSSSSILGALGAIGPFGLFVRAGCLLGKSPSAPLCSFFGATRDVRAGVTGTPAFLHFQI